MNKTIVSVAIALGLLVGTAGPSLAADPIAVNVDSFVVPNPSLTGCDIGNGILLAGDVNEHVHWSLDGQPLNITPQQRTLWFPSGFSGTVTATADAGYTLYEIDANRSATALTWQHVVEPCVPDQPAAPAATTADVPAAAPASAVTVDPAAKYRARIAVLTARVSHLREQGSHKAQIQRLRAKIQQLRAEVRAL